MIAVVNPFEIFNFELATHVTNQATKLGHAYAGWVWSAEALGVSHAGYLNTPKLTPNDIVQRVNEHGLYMLRRLGQDRDVQAIMENSAEHLELDEIGIAKLVALQSSLVRHWRYRRSVLPEARYFKGAIERWVKPQCRTKYGGDHVAFSEVVQIPDIPATGLGTWGRDNLINAMDGLGGDTEGIRLQHTIAKLGGNSLIRATLSGLIQTSTALARDWIRMERTYRNLFTNGYDGHP